jgi:hypothetical protein
MADDHSDLVVVSVDDEMREKVAGQLAVKSQFGGELYTKSPRSTRILYAAAPARLAFHREVIAQYLDLEPEPPREGLSAVLTAGPPGAGKSTLLHEQFDLQGYRRLDSDVVKDLLIERAIRDGIYDDLLSSVLADGAPLAPRELASLVHDESTALIDSIRAECVARRENVLIEGTLRWPDHGPKVLAQLAENEYISLRIIAVEVPRTLAHARALSRWWAGRLDWRAGTESLGGRFTPPGAIDDCYDGADLSRCGRNARKLTSGPNYGMTVTLTPFRPVAGGGFELSQ